MLIFDKQFSNSAAMKQQEVFNKIGGIIKELKEQYEYLEADPGKINELELELFVANTHFLVQNADVLRRIIAQNTPPKPAPKPVEPAESKEEEKYFEPLVHQPDATTVSAAENKGKAELTHEVSNDQPAADINIGADTPADDYSFIRQEPEVIRHELEIDESWVDDEDEAFDEPENLNISTEPEPVKDIAPNTTTEKKPQKIKQEEDIVTINQKISGQLGQKQGADLNVLPITDLKSAITLNDKLLYVKDLFNGYSLAYSEAIDILNRHTSFAEAENFLKSNYATKNNWDSKPETTAKFYALLKRKYV
jgi:hypothetical protein